jgi:hypothetical protein
MWNFCFAAIANLPLYMLFGLGVPFSIYVELANVVAAAVDVPGAQTPCVKHWFLGRPGQSVVDVVRRVVRAAIITTTVPEGRSPSRRGYANRTASQIPRQVAKAGPTQTGVAMH